MRRMLRDAKHHNHSALGTILHWHYVRDGELFSIIPLMGLADHIVNGGFPFDLPAPKPFFVEENSLLPKPEATCRIRRFLRHANPLQPREGVAGIGGRFHTCAGCG